MDTTSFYFETDDFRFRKHITTKNNKKINEKTTNEKMYPEVNNMGDINK